MGRAVIFGCIFKVEGFKAASTILYISSPNPFHKAKSTDEDLDLWLGSALYCFVAIAHDSDSGIDGFFERMCFALLWIQAGI